ncbi:T9SS type A sorting domain-containing protein [Lewinella sp. W8]|uniref:T9SS type A sorting domain-containing protein n=1 Tax=Lewinella sp. W8 TaxID=2528208 RepID=UPI001068408B|nr:T9SS type A sorting domain-containing protein [Lewinella sp. W8]MTB50928.1 T9SS type A sorting domain-containing protein [Lewinella sp. W8]
MRYLLLLALFAFGYGQAMACSCFGPRTFCETLSGFRDWDPDRGVNLVEVTSFNYRVINNDQLRNQPMIDIRIEKVFFGTMLPGQRFTLPLQDGANCRDWEGNYRGADSYILILDNTDSPPWGREGSVEGAFPFRSVTFCAVQSVKVNGNRVSGAISEGVEEMPYDRFFLKLNECLEGGITPAIDFTLFPNPSPGILRINPGSLEVDGVSVFDITGRLIYHAPEFEMINSSPGIDLSDQAPGIYLVRLLVGEDQVTRRVILR